MAESLYRNLQNFERSLKGDEDNKRQQYYNFLKNNDAGDINKKPVEYISTLINAFVRYDLTDTYNELSQREQQKPQDEKSCCCCCCVQ